LDITEIPLRLQNPFPYIPKTPKFLDTFETSRMILLLKYGIDCPPDCVCRKEGLNEALAKWKETFESIGTDETVPFCEDQKDFLVQA